MVDTNQIDIRALKKAENLAKERMAQEAALFTPPTVQFPWRRYWAEMVAPYLQEELVQMSLDAGMRHFPNWKRGEAPCDFGDRKVERPAPGTLEWYQPSGECRSIVFFALAIGIMNFPNLTWKIVTGDLHTVAVGHDSAGNPIVVMDILEFEKLTAEQSLRFAQTLGEASEQCAKTRASYEASCRAFCEHCVPKLRARALEMQARERAKGRSERQL